MYIHLYRCIYRYLDYHQARHYQISISLIISLSLQQHVDKQAAGDYFFLSSSNYNWFTIVIRDCRFL